METEQLNPFRPGMGVYPPFRAGRKRAWGILKEKLEQIRRGMVGEGLVLYGPRGNGKTTLLTDLWRRAQPEDVLAFSLLSKAMSGGHGGLKGKLVAGKKLPDKLFEKVEASVFGFGVGFELGGAAPIDIEVALRQMLGKTPVMLLIDEAHEMPADSGGAILQVAQDCIMRELPLLLVLAGTPGLNANLARTHSSFRERCLKLRIGRLESDEEARDALAIPARENGRPFNDDALELLLAECQRYPYFAQILGFESWRAATDAGHTGRITLEDAVAGLGQANEEREEFYADRLSEIERAGLLAEATAISKAMVAKGQTPHLPNKELRSLLRGMATKDGPSPLAVIEDLVRLGLIWRVHGSNWEPGIPSLCTYLVEHGGD